MDPELTLPLDQAYQLMLERHGHQGWWPADTDFEMCVGPRTSQNLYQLATILDAHDVRA